jgi:hypothetical protein
MFMRDRRAVNRRQPERRCSPESVFNALAGLLGPRLRQQSSFQLRVGLEAIPAGSGAVMVITIPAGTNDPVEVHTYPSGVTIGLLGPAPIYA